MPKMRRLRIIAQDPSVTSEGTIITSLVEIPYERLAPGPRGHRVHVVDYDASQGLMWEPAKVGTTDRFEEASDGTLVDSPGFHAQNCYAIVMRILHRFEQALGRRVCWGFGGHQIYVAPHAFADSNAYYSEEDHCLLFGYFPGCNRKTDREEMIFSCLSHDIIAHEATHALLDGLRDNYTLPSLADQDGFHEGFADVVALLSVFGLKGIVSDLLTYPRLTAKSKNATRRRSASRTNMSCDELTLRAFRDSVLTGLAEQFGQETSDFREKALRQAAKRRPNLEALKSESYEECHLRGELLSGAILNAFLGVWRSRLKSWIPRKPLDGGRGAPVAVGRVVEDGVEAAEHLLTMIIRALDYCPVVDIQFKDFLSALLTADYEVVPDDAKYHYRKALVEQFGRWGIIPAAPMGEEPDTGERRVPGGWEMPKGVDALNYHCIHPESLHRDPDEVFRFLWENRGPLRVFEDAHAQVTSVRPCVRVGPDGFVVRETVAEYRQMLDLEARELKRLGIRKPPKMPDATAVRLYGGGVLVFDEFTRLKYHVRSRVDSPIRQSKRLQYLFQNDLQDEHGRYGFADGVPRGRRFAVMHLRRAGRIHREERWNA